MDMEPDKRSSIEVCEVEHRSGKNSLMNGIGYKANCLGFCPLDLVFKTSQTTVPSRLVPSKAQRQNISA